MTDFHLAQCTMVTLRSDLPRAALVEWEWLLKPLFGWTERSRGFLFRLMCEDPATSLLNGAIWMRNRRDLYHISMWQDIQVFSDFSFGKAHEYLVRNKTRWAPSVARVQFVMWWLPAGQPPTLSEANAKLITLEESGPTPAAFNWHQTFSPQGETQPKYVVPGNTKA